jgi:integrase
MLYCADNDSMLKRYKAKLADSQGNLAKWITGGSLQEVVDTVVAEVTNRMLQELVAGKAEAQIEPVVLRDYARNWQRVYQAHIRHNTRSAQNSLLEKHILADFGDRDIRSITTESIQEMMNKKASANLSKKTIKEIKVLFSSILQSAVEDTIISINPAKSRRLVNGGKVSEGRKALTTMEFADVIGNLGVLKTKRERRFLALLAFLGFRPEEVRGLKREDIDLEGRRIYVRRVVTFNLNQPVIETTKTEAGLRPSVIPEELVQWLELTEDKNQFLFGGDKPLTEHTYRQMWKRMEKTINLHGATPYWFRHTFATQGKRGGVSQKTMQTIGGWKDGEVLNDVYTHTQEEDLEIAKKQLDSVFSSLLWNKVGTKNIA